VLKAEPHPTGARSLPRPAPLGKHGSGRVGCAPQQARELERFIAFGAGRQQTCPLQRIRSADFLIDPVWRPLRLFHRHFARRVTRSYKRPAKCRPQIDSLRSCAIPHRQMFYDIRPSGRGGSLRLQLQIHLTRSLPARVMTPIIASTPVAFLREASRLSLMTYPLVRQRPPLRHHLLSAALRQGKDRIGRI
jgi:hypothetical protein